MLVQTGATTFIHFPLLAKQLGLIFLCVARCPRAPGLSVTTLSADQFSLGSPLVWFLLANHAGLLDLYARYMQLQYDAYDEVAEPLLKEIRVVSKREWTARRLAWQG